MLPNETEAIAKIASELRSDFEAAERLHNVVVGMLSGTWRPPTRGLSPLVLFSIAGLMTKACKTYRAIQHVCAAGLGQDATVLLRSLYETMVAVLFILQKRSRERAVIYQAYGIASGLKMLHAWKRTPGLKRRATKSVIAQTEQACHQWAAQLPPGTDYSRHWSGKRSLEQAAKALRGAVSYDLFYRYASPFAHAADLVDHMDLRSAPVFAMRLIPGDLHVAGTLAVARLMLWLTASRVNERFRLGCDEPLEAERPPDVRRFELVADGDGTSVHDAHGGAPRRGRLAPT
jgi:hypothetical protein